MMDNHIHDWKIQDSAAQDVHAKCDCGKGLTVDQIENILNLDYINFQKDEDESSLDKRDVEFEKEVGLKYDNGEEKKSQV
jgi:hypothetical protein